MSWDSIRTATFNYSQHTDCYAYFLQTHTLYEAFDLLDFAATRFLPYDKDVDGIELDLRQLLAVSHRLRASDPRDHIYGLLGLLKPAKRVIKIDYHLSTREVFRRAATAIMRHDPSAKYLMTMFSPNREPSPFISLPSWVSDLPCSEFVVFVMRICQLFMACGAHKKVDFKMISEKVVSYVGSIVDHVASLEEYTFDMDKVLLNGVQNVTHARVLLDFLQNIEQLVRIKKAL